MSRTSPWPVGGARRWFRLRALAAAGAALLAVTVPGLAASAAPAPPVASVDGASASLAALAGIVNPLPQSDLEAAADLESAGVDAASVGVETTEEEAAESGLQVRHAAIRLHGQMRGRMSPAAAVRQVEGVSLATAVLLGTLRLAPGEDERELEVAAVHPAFRWFTPEVTASADQVWERVREGDAALIHEVGEELRQEHGIGLGERVTLAPDEAAGPESEGPTLRIGAYASNGGPPVAEAVVSRATAAALGMTGETVVLVALDEGADAEEVAARLEEHTGMRAEVLAPPSVRRAFLSRGESNEAFEPFRYVSLGDGMIQIEQDWVRRNISTERVPIFRGPVTCHRLMIPQLRGALQEISDRGLAHLINPSQYGGCWVPRHILFNPRRAISMHAWGLAIDFNVSTNQYGAQPQMDPQIVDIFQRWGFSWGGHWSTPDGMHFELAVLLDTGDR